MTSLGIHTKRPKVVSINPGAYPSGRMSAADSIGGYQNSQQQKLNKGESKRRGFTTKAANKNIQIDFTKLAAKLPVGNSPHDKEMRKKLFRDFDPNGNGYLSLAEIEKGFRDVLRLEGLQKFCKPVFLRAYYAARNVNNKAEDSVGASYIEWNEFRMLLAYLKQYFEYFHIYSVGDTNMDRRLDMDEFVAMVPALKGYGMKIRDPYATFAELDTNGGGIVLFDEFCDWAFKKRLDVIKGEMDDAEELFDHYNQDQYAQPSSSEQPQTTVRTVDLDQLSRLNIDFEDLQAKLPIGTSPEQKKERMKLFQLFDPNGNGFLSLAEIEKGFRDVLRLEELQRTCKPVFIRAYYAARNIDGKLDKDIGSSYVERAEFRWLLIYLRQYFEYFYVFTAGDTNNDRRLDFQEFCNLIPQLEKCGVHIEDAYASFQQIDGNAGGHILFDEFCDWAIKQQLDLIRDDDEEALFAGQGDIKFERSEKARQRHMMVDLNKLSRLKVPWDQLDEILPTQKTAEDRKKRTKLFKAFDPNGNGLISLAEIGKGFQDVLKLGELNRIAAPVFLRAYDAARNFDVGSKKKKIADAYIQKSEFRILLVYLKQYFEYFKIFSAGDVNLDGRLDLQEFKNIFPHLELYGLFSNGAKMSAGKVFREIDRNHGGIILFDEFCEWAISKHLDLISSGDENEMFTRLQNIKKKKKKFMYEPRYPAAIKRPPRTKDLRMEDRSGWKYGKGFTQDRKTQLQLAREVVSKENIYNAYSFKRKEIRHTHKPIRKGHLVQDGAFVERPKSAAVASLAKQKRAEQEERLQKEKVQLGMDNPIIRKRLQRRGSLTDAAEKPKLKYENPVVAKRRSRRGFVDEEPVPSQNVMKTEAKSSAPSWWG